MIIPDLGWLNDLGLESEDSDMPMPNEIKNTRPPTKKPAKKKKSRLKRNL